MSRYIDADKLINDLVVLVCGACENGREQRAAMKEKYSVEEFIKEVNRQPAADVREIRKEQWHIMPEDANDESGAPTEEGRYLVIDENGNEYVDYFFGEPRMTPKGVSYWLNSDFVIRAWIKMGGETK